MKRHTAKEWTVEEFDDWAAASDRFDAVEKLMEYIVALGRDVEIIVRPKRYAAARVLVLEAA